MRQTMHILRKTEITFLSCENKVLSKIRQKLTKTQTILTRYEIYWKWSNIVKEIDDFSTSDWKIIPTRPKYGRSTLFRKFSIMLQRNNQAFDIYAINTHVS